MAEVDGKTQIIGKALHCIDECLPAADVTAAGFPTEAFIDEAVRWVIDTIPVSAFEKGNVLSATLPISSKGYYGEASLLNGESSTRILSVSSETWGYPVMDIITESHPLYRQQKNVVLRGNAMRPVVVHIKKSEKIEVYPYTPNATCTYVLYDVGGIPELAYDLTSWKLAELVLLAMNDTDAAAICTSKVEEHLKLLAS